MIRVDSNSSVYVEDIEPNVEYSIRIQDLLSRIEKLEEVKTVISDYDYIPNKPERTEDRTTNIFLTSNMSPGEERLIRFRWNGIKENYVMKFNVIETDNWLKRLSIGDVKVFDGMVEILVENSSESMIQKSRTYIKLSVDNKMFETELNLFNPCGC